MDQCTHDVRSARWKQTILDCQQRPADKSVKQWLEENHILEQSYYYWQRKFRKEAYDQMENACLPSIEDNKNAVSFVEIAAPVHKKVPIECNSETIKPAVVIKTATMSIAISNDISDQLLSKILQEVAHA
jgi:putative transposase